MEIAESSLMQVNRLLEKYQEELNGYQKSGITNKYIEDGLTMDIGNLYYSKETLVKRLRPSYRYYAVDHNILCTNADDNIVSHHIEKNKEKNPRQYTDADLEVSLHEQGYVAFVIDTSGDIRKTEF